MKNKKEGQSVFCLSERHVAQIVRRNMISKRKESAKSYSRQENKKQIRGIEF